MLVGEVKNGYFSALSLTPQYLEKSQSSPFLESWTCSKSQTFTILCAVEDFSLLFTGTPNCLLVIAVEQQHVTSSVNYHFVQDCMSSVPINSFLFCLFPGISNVSSCFHSPLLFCCLLKYFKFFTICDIQQFGSFLYIIYSALQ